MLCEVLLSQNYSEYFNISGEKIGENNKQIIFETVSSFNNVKAIAGFNKNVNSVKKTFIPPQENELTRQMSARLFKLCAPKVVWLFSLDLSVIGSGVIINNEGEILTNWHVVEGIEKFYTYFFDKKISNYEDLDFYNYYISDVVAIDKHRDLALLKLQESKSLQIPKKVILASRNEIKIGNETFAIGHPEGLPWSPTFGFISRIREDYNWDYESSSHEATVIQTQTPIGPGSSGGALFNEKGYLIGINSMGSTSTLGLNFAVHVDEVKDFLKGAHEGKYNFEYIEKDDGVWLELDVDNNGVIDGYILDNDEIIWVMVDKNEDNIIDIWLMDTNMDNVWDIEVYDKDNNGSFEYFLVDEDFDGQFDKVRVDTDGDYIPDISFDYVEN
jgi:S1-C subfamily serine protease